MGEDQCDTCRVELMEENEDAAMVFVNTRRQVITAGMNGNIIDINLCAVKDVMDAYEIADQKTCMEKVASAFRHFLAKKKSEE